MNKYNSDKHKYIFSYRNCIVIKQPYSSKMYNIFKVYFQSIVIKVKGNFINIYEESNTFQKTLINAE